MKRFILATHAYMSKGIKSSLELILGKQENLSVYCAYAEGEPFFKPLVIQEVEDHPEDEFVIMTDLFGGSVNNELLELTTRRNVHVVTGTNLILAMSILLTCPESDDVAATIRNCVEDAKTGIVYCNDMEIDSDLDEL